MATLKLTSTFLASNWVGHLKMIKPTGEFTNVLLFNLLIQYSDENSQVLIGI